MYACICVFIYKSKNLITFIILLTYQKYIILYINIGKKTIESFLFLDKLKY